MSLSIEVQTDAIACAETSSRRSRSASVPTAAELAARFPISPGAAQNVARFREQIIELVQGRDGRMLAVIGPCSVHEPRAALEYAERLRPVAERLSDDLLVVMRVYLEKPRSSVGWKGLISDPHLDGRCDVAHGLTLARELMTRIAELGLPIATELLDANLSSYQTDLISWAAIGARTTESQPHRELASSLAFAVGFKNGTDGRLDGALGGIVSASRPHHRLAPDQHGRLVLTESSGNPNCHVTLRGGEQGPNYEAEFVGLASARARAAGLPARVLIDCSHGNSGKDHDNQPRVLEDVAGQLARAECPVLGVMIESHLVAGRQALAEGPRGLTYGQSITDACVDFQTGERMLISLARATRARALRSAGSKASTLSC
jgi:3-deoxy-7-phosphoheptulonate synthase